MQDWMRGPAAEFKARNPQQSNAESKSAEEKDAEQRTAERRRIEREAEDRRMNDLALGMVRDAHRLLVEHQIPTDSHFEVHVRHKELKRGYAQLWEDKETLFRLGDGWLIAEPDYFSRGRDEPSEFLHGLCLDTEGQIRSVYGGPASAHFPRNVNSPFSKNFSDHNPADYLELDLLFPRAKWLGEKAKPNYTRLTIGPFEIGVSSGEKDEISFYRTYPYQAESGKAHCDECARAPRIKPYFRRDNPHAQLLSYSLYNYLRKKGLVT